MISEPEEALSRLKPHFKFIGPPKAGRRFDAVCVQTAEAAAKALNDGYSADRIFGVSFRSEDLPELIGKCRLVASGFGELRSVNAAAANIGAGQPVRLGLRLSLNKDAPPDAFRLDNLDEISERAKGLPNVSLGGFFVSGDIKSRDGREIGRYIRSCYEAAKRTAFALPCSAPYIVMENALAAIKALQTEAKALPAELLREVLTVAMQNATSFYAKLYLS